jgi:hypothetical protein
MADFNPIRELRQRIEELEEEIRQLKSDLSKDDDVFAKFLSPQQSALLMGIYKCPCASYDYLDNITERHGFYNRYEGEMHQTLRTRVAVWKLRKKMKMFGIEINILRGYGYYLDDENKAKLKQLMEKKDD